MALRFAAGDKARVLESHRRWWEGSLGRPIVQVRVHTEDKWPEGVAPLKSFTAFYEQSLSAAAIAESWEADLARQVFIGDAFPQIWPNFGPGVAAAFLGAELECGDNTVWFHPSKPMEIAEISFRYDAGNRWLRRVLDIVAAADAKLDPSVVIGHPDLGGAMDILSSFRLGEDLLMDLYDAPAKVGDLEAELLELWWRFYQEFDAITSRRGRSCWTPLLSGETYYMLQSDFSYMIGPEMFGEFVMPRLVEFCARIENAFYHLDGVGQLPHLDQLLSIERLRGIQWVPGDGQPPVTKWDGVYRRIIDGGKRSQLFGDLDTLRHFADHVDGFENIAFVLWASPKQEKEALKLLDELGVV